MKVHIEKWTLAKEFFNSGERRIFYVFFNPTFIWYTPSAGQDLTGSLWRRLRNACWRGSYLFLLINAKVSLSDRFWYFSVNKKINHAYIYHQGKCIWIWKWINWRFKKKNLRRVVAGLDESASASTETQNYTEPYVEEPLADEEWLQNYRKEQEDKEGLARKLKSTLMSVPVSESHPPSKTFSFCCPYNTESLFEVNLAQWRSFTGLLFTKTRSAAIFLSCLRYCVLRVEGFLRILILFLGSAVLLQRVVTRLLGIFKGIIPYYTDYIAIPFSLEVTCSLIYVTAVLWPEESI